MNKLATLAADGWAESLNVYIFCGTAIGPAAKGLEK
jgi:hypothetical protein